VEPIGRDMIPLRQLVYKNLPRSSILRTRAQVLVGSRFQSTVQTSNNEVKVVNEKQPFQGKRKASKFKPVNNKLRDISSQIRASVNSSSNDLTESIEILEEGLSYLREIQQVEGLSDETIFSIFQPILASIIDKSLDPSYNTNRSVNEILDIFISYNVAHAYHFTKAMVHELKSGEDRKVMYENVLHYWVKFIEYSKISNNPYVFKMYRVLRENGFNQHDIKNLAYYAYVQSCLLQDLKYDFKDALKLLQTEELPEIFQIKRSIMSLGLNKSLSKDFQLFEKKLEAFNLESLDPNGSIIINKINNAIIHSDANLLNRVYEQMQDASVKNNKPINENTLIRLMNGYYECQVHSKVFQVFQQMIQNGIEKPSIASWDFVIRSMGHPSYIRGFTKEQRDTTINNIERTVETIIGNDTELTPKTLSIIVGCFANLNRFDKVDEFLNKYSTDGEGSLKVIHTANNNILIGLLLNKRITEAEEKLKELMANGSNYVPSTTAMNSFINHYAKAKNYKAVDGILKFMKQYNIPDEVGTYTIVIDLYFKLHREKGFAPDIQELLSSFKNAGVNGLQINEYTLATLIDGLVKDGTNLAAARVLYDHISKKNKLSPQTMTSMMKGELDYGLIGNAETIFDKYIKAVRNDARIWNLMIKSLLAKHENLALNYYLRFKEQSKLNLKIQPNYYTFYFLLSHFLKKGKTEQVQFLINEMADKTNSELGYELPKILRSLTDKYKFPSNLLHEINKSN
jgi:hypothetical protein